MSHDAVVVIRTCGERTFDLCQQIVYTQVHPDNVFVVQERPFVASLQRTYEIGLSHAQKWLIAVDADRLIRQDALSTLISAAESAAPTLFELRGLTLDKFFGGRKDGSIRVYRTAYLAEALNHLPARGQETLRPETYVIKEMGKRGWDSRLLSDTVLCLHDFEQFYSHIYRKAFAHARKHARYLRYLIPMWQRLAAEDFDYQVALWGARASLIQEELSPMVGSEMRDGITPLLAAAGRAEKEPLDPAAWQARDVLNFIERYQSPPEYGGIQAIMAAPAGGQTYRQTISNAYRQFGILRWAPWLLGKWLDATGQKLQRWAAQKCP